VESVGIAVGCWLDGRGVGVLFPAGAGDICLLHSIQAGSGALTASYPVGTGSHFLEEKRFVGEADHSPPSGAEVKYGGAVPPFLHASSWRDV
jgi:hypothetical protein